MADTAHSTADALDLSDDVEVVTLLSLPFELHVELARCARGVDAISLGRCCRALNQLLSCDSLWRHKLRSEWGFTDEAFDLWLSTKRTLVQAFHYHAVKHEPLEFSMLREPKETRAPDWEGCRDLTLSIEMANPWPRKVWTLFRICSPGGDDGAAPCAWAAEAETGELHLWSWSPQRIHCAGYAATKGCDAVVLSIASMPAPPPPSDPAAVDAATDGQPPPSIHPWSRIMPCGNHISMLPWTSFGWMLGVGETSTVGVTVDVTGGRSVAARPATHAMLLPPHASGSTLVVLAEHVLRVDESTWEEISSAGAVSIEVMQCVELRAYGLHEVLEDASPYELCTDAGAEVLTTARPTGSHNRKLAGRAFEWRPSERREAMEAEHRHETTRHVVLPPLVADATRVDSGGDYSPDRVCDLSGATMTIEGGWEVADDARAAPTVHEALPPLRFTVLCRHRAVAPLT